MKRCFKRVLILLTVFVILFAAAVGVFAYRPDIQYVISSKLELVGAGELPYKIDCGDVCEYSKEELTEMDNVVFNESMRLINEENPCGGEQFDIGEYKDSGVYMNTCALEDYAALSQAVRKETATPLYVSSAYRSYDEQVQIYESDDESVAAKPGTSEHEAGLGIDLYVSGFAGYGFLKSEAGQFVDSNAWKYGFIIRYPMGKRSETGIKYEPWHIRYVGQPHSEIIDRNGLCLEEYVKIFEPGAFYSYGRYILTVQQGDSFDLPRTFSHAVISEINGGRYMITVT